MSIAKVRKAANFLRDVPFAGARGVFLCLDHPTFSSGGRIRATRLTRALRLRVPQITIQNWSWGRRLPVVRICLLSAHLESSYTCIDFKRLINPLLLWLLSHWRLSEYLNAKRTREDLATRFAESLSTFCARYMIEISLLQQQNGCRRLCRIKHKK